MRRRLAALVLIAVGVTFVVMTFANSLFSVGPAFERMTDEFRPVMAAGEISANRANVTGLGAALDEYQEKGVPLFAGALQMTPAQLSAYVKANFPAVDAAIRGQHQTIPQFLGVVNLLEAERARFASADAIPTKAVPATVLPWAVLGVGLVSIVVGLIMLRPGHRGTGTAILLGALLVVVPLMTTLPAKAGDADQMNSHLKPVYSAQMIAGARQTLAGFQAMGNEIQSKMIPAMATSLKMTPAEIQQTLARQLPAMSAALAGMPAAFGRFERLVETFDGSLSDYDLVKETSMGPIVWTLIGGGFAILLAGAAAAWKRTPLVVPAERRMARAA